MLKEKYSTKHHVDRNVTYKKYSYKSHPPTPVLRANSFCIFPTQMTQNKAKIFLMNDRCNNKHNRILPVGIF